MSLRRKLGELFRLNAARTVRHHRSVNPSNASSSTSRCVMSRVKASCVRCHSRKLLEDLTMRLFISEKPSLAEAVAKVLPGAVRKEGAVTYVGDDAFVPLAGHALAQAMPDAYLPDDVPLNKKGKKIWREQDLPIVPSTWIMEPEARLQRNLAAIEKLLKTVDEVVHLGAPET